MDMVESILDVLTSFREAIRPADVMDILVIAGVLYLVILWIRQHASRAVIIGLSLIAAVYLTAHQLDMVLTSWLFQAGLAALLIGLILVFQNDIRNLFNRLAAALGIVGASRSMRTNTAEIVSRSLAALGRKRIGALVVLRGRDPLDIHTHGGEELDGRLSGSLIDSIFDPSSHGHDGAMIVEGDRVARFGVHLPLSEDLRQLERHGTRHAAALGLAERTDALVAIVSEEQGTLSVAHRGVLARVDDESGLLERIRRFLRDTGDGGEPAARWFAAVIAWMKPAILRHWPTKLLSIALALLLWVAVAYRIDVSVRQLSVPVEFHDLPQTLQIKDVDPQVVTLTLSGPKRRFALMDTNTLRVSLDLSAVGPGRAVRALEERHVNLPAGGVTVSDFSPESVSFTIEEKPPAE